LATKAKVLTVLAVSNDGDTIAYEIHTTKTPSTSAVELYVVHVRDRSIKLLRTFAGPFIKCLGDAAFDPTAQRVIAVGCGSGHAAGLLILRTADGSIISQDDKFFAWPGQWAFSADLKTVWLIVDGTRESDVVRYDTATRTRKVLYRSPVWLQSDGSAAPNLPGPVLLAPDETHVIFSRYTRDRSPEVYVLPSAGGTATVIFKSSTFGRLESWSPGGAYVAISVDNSTPTQRMRLIDPRTKAISAVNTGAEYIEFLAWIVP
jgi:Tol biopolymer transport system component